MSGHSKWAQIKRQKGVADQKRGQAFTKLSNAVTLAVKQGGGIGDPGQNFRLRLAIDAARSLNMPKENIERAIQKALGGKEQGVEEVIYEGFAPGGASVIVEAVTDNPMRTTSEVKSVFNKAGASFGQPGSVSYQFKQVGLITVEKGDKSFDDIFALGLDAGADDIEDSESAVDIYTTSSNLYKVKEELSKKGLNVLQTELTRKPLVNVSLDSEEKKDKILNFLASLENLEDVQKVYTNINF
jgi:YebC/PmpR family DNA-binding regulatory protein